MVGETRKVQLNASIRQPLSLLAPRPRLPILSRVIVCLENLLALGSGEPVLAVRDLQVCILNRSKPARNRSTQRTWFFLNSVHPSIPLPVTSIT